MGLLNVANSERPLKGWTSLGAKVLNLVAIALVYFGYFDVSSSWLPNPRSIQYSLRCCFRNSASTNKKPKVLEIRKEESPYKPD